MISEVEKQIYHSVLGVEVLKERLKKRSELKMKNLYKD